jgi:hypothetical protein
VPTHLFADDALGAGFLESVYQAALAVEFAIQRIGFDREVALL